MKIVIACCCGLPASGKTSFCTKLLQSSETSAHIVRHICFDTFIENSLCEGFFDPLSWHTGRKKAFEYVAETISSLVRDFSDHNTEDAIAVVLLDDNMHYRRMRHDSLQIARKYGCGFSILYFPVNLSVSMARNSTRSNPVPNDVILKMFEKFEPPDLLKCKWEKFTIRVMDFDTLLQLSKVWETLIEASRCQQIEKISNLNCKVVKINSDLKQVVDLALREEVNHLMLKVRLQMCKDIEFDLPIVAAACAEARKILNGYVINKFL